MRGRSLMQGRSPCKAETHAINAGVKPDARPKPNAVNAGKRTGLVSIVRTRREMCIGTLSLHAWASVGRHSVHGSPCHGGRVKAAGDLPAKVGTTRLSCGVGGRDERPLVTTRLVMEKWRPRVVYP
ncbi:hypothetical protein CRG98_015320 [Punica granatum]|uniref:Uncharacterized protein n=1 Tax=Punica granatum TaxID=22663 RepID=A0A2I0K7X5_PUNGR|nr:hypothetical protein CRG98_015320 [Punica granatum]